MWTWTPIYWLFSISRVEISSHVPLIPWEITTQPMCVDKDWYCLCIPLLTDGQNKLLWGGTGQFLRPTLEVVRQQQRVWTTTTVHWVCCAPWIWVKWTMTFFPWLFVLSHLYILWLQQQQKNFFDVFEIEVHWCISGKLLRCGLNML